MKPKTYVIQCVYRQADCAPSFFAAIHSYSQFFVSNISKAKQFATEEEALNYGVNELFTSKHAFRVITN